jgi:TetR/AcrR family transcriptional repressor of nem operon
MPRKKKYIREDVTEKAMSVFWNNGYKATSMRMLEKEMGINLYSIYADFNSKEGIFLETLKRYRQLNKEVILKPLIDSDGDLEDIRKFFYGFVQSVKSGKTPNGCLFANTAMEIGNTDAKVLEQLNIFFKILKDAYLNLLINAMKNKQISKNADVDRYANFLVGATEGIAVTSKVLDENKLKDYIETTLSVLK